MKNYVIALGIALAAFAVYRGAFAVDAESSQNVKIWGDNELYKADVNASNRLKVDAVFTSPATITANQGLQGINTSPWYINLRNASGTELGIAATPLRIDPTGTTTQPVSGTVAVTQSTSPWVTSRNWVLSNGTDSVAAVQSGTWSVRAQDGSGNPLASSTSAPAGSEQALLVRNIPSGTQTISGTVSATQGTSPWVTSASQSGTWTVQQGTPPWSMVGNVASGATDSGNPVKAGGVYNSSAPVLTTGQRGDLQLDTSARLITNVGISALPSGAATEATLTKLPIAQSTALGSNSGPLVQGSVTTAAPSYTTGNINPLSLTTAGALRVDGSGITQTISGTVTSNQGTAAALAGAWPVKVTDGTNTMPTMDAVGRAGFQKVTDGTNTAAVKAASTAAGASDPSLVVALSPNSALPTGSNNVGSITNITGTISLPTGASTSANQTTEIAALQLIDNLPHANDVALNNGVPTMGQLDDMSTGTVIENNVSTVRITAARALHTNLRNAAGTEVGTSSSRLFVDSAPSSNVLSTANSTTTPLAGGGVFTGTYEDLLAYADVVLIIKTDAASASLGLEIDWSSDGVNIDDTDTFNIMAGVGTQYSFGTMARYMRVKYTNGAGAQGTFRLQTTLKRTRGKPSSHRIESSITGENDAELVKAVVTGKDPSGIYQNLHVDTNGNLITSALTGFGADFTFGDVATTALTQVLVNRTSYTEPASATSFSIKSSSASDASAGTGARTINVEWLDGSGNGRYSEVMTLNGTTCVNSVATTAHYFEELQVLTVGSGGTNAGTVTFYTGSGCSTVVGTIGVGDEQTFWSHHYVPNGKTSNITGLSVSHNGTTVGSGGVFVIKSISIGVANANELQISDFHRLYGQSSTIARTYSSPLKVVGPARTNIYVTPETSSATTYRASMDFFEP